MRKSSAALALREDDTQYTEIFVMDNGKDKGPFAYRIAIPSDTFENALVQIGEIHGQIPRIQEDLKACKDFQANWQKRFGRFWPAFCFGVVFGVLGVVEFIFLMLRSWPSMGKVLKGIVGW